MTVVVTACSNRKSNKPVRMMHAATIPRGSLQNVGRNWLGRVRASKKLIAAGELYQGRSFFEACAAAGLLGADLYIVSAGLGLLRHETPVPAYGLTVTGGSPDNILRRIKGGEDSGMAARWWDLIVRGSPVGASIARIVRESSPHLVLIALPSAYLDMVADDLASIHGRSVGRLRIFVRTIPLSFPEKLRPAIMPYDDRLNGPDSLVQGTRSDFAARALRHFAERILSKAPAGDLSAHRRMVTSALARWRDQVIPSRPRRTDSELIALIAANWYAADGKSSRMLRVLRDDLGVACEQSRFIGLFARAKARLKRRRP